MASMFRKDKSRIINRYWYAIDGWKRNKRYAKANNKYRKNYNKDVTSSYLTYLDANNLYEWAMSQKLSVNSFKWVKKLSRFNEIFIKNCNENSNTRYCLEVDIDYPKKFIWSS